MVSSRSQGLSACTGRKSNFLLLLVFLFLLFLSSYLSINLFLCYCTQNRLLLHYLSVLQPVILILQKTSTSSSPTTTTTTQKNLSCNITTIFLYYLFLSFATVPNHNQPHILYLPVTIIVHTNSRNVSISFVKPSDGDHHPHHLCHHYYSH